MALSGIPVVGETARTSVRAAGIGIMASAFLLFIAGSAGAAEAVPRPGEAAYRQYCSFCHDAGTVGAPQIGDKAAWAPRLKQNNDALMQSAWNGKGHMLPRRWRADLDEDQFLRALGYLLDASR